MAKDIANWLRMYAQQFEDQHAPQNMTIALREAAKELDRLRERLEIYPTHPYDGIYCRDETIRGQDAEITRLTELVERGEAVIQNMRYAEDENHQKVVIENVRLREVLKAVRFNLLQAGYKPDSIMIEGIDAALTAQERKDV